LLPGRPRRADEIPRASLVDVAFLALIFFAVCAAFAVEEGLVLQLPVGGSAPGRIARTTTVRVTGSADGRVEIDGRPVAVNMVRPAVEAAIARSSKTIIIVEAGPQVQYQLMVDILGQLKLAQASRISLKERSATSLSARL
jgi:biopolymer transport protein ExbD